MINKYNVVDLFAGCGGLSDGFEQSGSFHTLGCVEWERIPCNTLLNRLENKWGYKEAREIVMRFDIQRTEELISGWNDDPKFGSHIGLDNSIRRSGKKVDIIIGGPPCQAYSIAGRIRDENGMNNDYRNFLFESYLKVVSFFKPKLFVFENVPGLLSAMPGGVSITQRIADAFAKKGYEICSNLRDNALIDCTQFGVPQARRRMIIIGVRKSAIKHNIQDALIDFYKNILPSYHISKQTVKSAIDDLPKFCPLPHEKIVNGKKYSHTFEEIKIANHVPRMHSKRDIAIFEKLTLDIEKEDYKYNTSDSLKQLYFEVTGKQSNIHKYHVLRWDRPSNTIPAHLYKDGLRHIHPDPKQSRTITVREAARLQSFDDDFEFLGSMTDQYKMVGNAVPPKFAKAVAFAVNDFIKKYY